MRVQSHPDVRRIGVLASIAHGLLDDVKQQALLAGFQFVCDLVIHVHRHVLMERVTHLLRNRAYGRAQALGLKNEGPQSKQRVPDLLAARWARSEICVSSSRAPAGSVSSILRTMLIRIAIAATDWVGPSWRSRASFFLASSCTSTMRSFSSTRSGKGGHSGPQWRLPGDNIQEVAAHRCEIVDFGVGE